MRITRGYCPKQGDCNFEDGTLCEYENLVSTEIKWKVRRGPGPNSGIGLIILYIIYLIIIIIIFKLCPIIKDHLLIIR